MQNYWRSLSWRGRVIPVLQACGLFRTVKMGEKLGEAIATEEEAASKRLLTSWLVIRIPDETKNHVGHKKLDSSNRQLVSHFKIVISQ